MGNSIPSVSIIVRTKDRPKLLRRALQSIAAQTYRPIEVVLVNDGGCGLDVSDLTGLLGDVSLRYVPLEKNTGRAHAGNVGIQNATGEYIGFLDDDDEFYPEHVSTLAPLLQKGDFRIAYADTEMVYRTYDPETGDAAEIGRHLFSSRDFSRHDLLLENYITLISLLFHRDVFGAEGGFDEQFLAYEDWDLLIRCGEHFPFRHIARVTARYIQWSKELQIAQSSAHAAVLEGEYDKVIMKHRGKFAPDAARRFRDTIAGLQAVIRQREGAPVGEAEALRTLEHALKDRDADIGALRMTVADLESRLREREDYISRIHAGRGWRLLVAYYKMRDRLFHGLH